MDEVARDDTWDPADGDEIDVEAGRERLRDAPEPPAAPDGAPEVPAALADVRPDLETLHETSDVQRPALASHRRVFGSAVLAVKRLLLRFLTPSLERQARHNTASTRLLTHLALRLERLERQVEALSAAAAAAGDGGPRQEEGASGSPADGTPPDPPGAAGA